MANKMTSLDRLAQQANGRSQACAKCPYGGVCPQQVFDICSRSFIEGFKKGYKAKRKDKAHS